MKLKFNKDINIYYNKNIKSNIKKLEIKKNLTKYL